MRDRCGFACSVGVILDRLHVRHGHECWTWIELLRQVAHCSALLLLSTRGERLMFSPESAASQDSGEHGQVLSSLPGSCFRPQHHLIHHPIQLMRRASGICWCLGHSGRGLHDTGGRRDGLTHGGHVSKKVLESRRKAFVTKRQACPDRFLSPRQG